LCFKSHTGLNQQFVATVIKTTSQEWKECCYCFSPRVPARTAKEFCSHLTDPNTRTRLAKITWFGSSVLAGPWQGFKVGGNLGGRFVFYIIMNSLVTTNFGEAQKIWRAQPLNELGVYGPAYLVGGHNYLYQKGKGDKISVITDW